MLIGNCVECQKPVVDDVHARCWNCCVCGRALHPRCANVHGGDWFYCATCWPEPKPAADARCAVCLGQLEGRGGAARQGQGFFYCAPCAAKRYGY